MNFYWMLTCDRCMVCVSIALQNFLQKNKVNACGWLLNAQVCCKNPIMKAQSSSVRIDYRHEWY